LGQTVRLSGQITPEQVRRSPFLYLPFRVPPRTRRIHVSYDYSEPVTAPFGMGPGSVVDIGIFDSRGHDFVDAPGFRGWSGTSKKEFFITAADATPGYIRGPLFPGEWNILLGVDRIDPFGARYDVTVTLDVGDRGEPEAEIRPISGGAPSASGATGRPRWVKGDLHCHTLHSDGENSVEDMVQHAIGLGLDYLAVTDHNTTTHHEELDRLSHLPITLIPGEEITTYFGHANTWGLREWIEFRCADEESIRRVQRHVLAKGALISINHAKCVGPPWLFDAWEGYPAMEVWQAPWRFYNWESLERWDGMLLAGERVVAVGGSDVHSIPPKPPRHPHGLANPCTWVYAEDGGSEESVLDGIRKGHVFVTDAPRGAHLKLLADVDGDGVFEKMMGDTVEAPEGKRVQFRVEVHGGMDRRLWLVCDGVPLDIVPLSDVDTVFNFSLELSGRSYVRAELRGNRGRPERGEVIWAMTNPIWLMTRNVADGFSLPSGRSDPA
jgi:hypothetical protein